MTDEKNLDQNKQNHIGTTSAGPLKQNVTLAILVMCLLIGFVYISIQTTPKIVEPPASVDIISEDEPPCPVYHKRFNGTVEALTDAQNVCDMQIKSTADLKKLITVKNSFPNLHMLLVVDIDDAEIPSEIYNFSSLMELRFDGTSGISDVSPDIGKLSNLVALNFSDTDIEKIPPEVAELKNLKTLYISRNEELTTVPVSIAKLTNLENITVRYNPKLPVPDVIVSYPKLQSIEITGANVTKIPPALYQLHHLTSLIYTDNKINSVSAEISNLTSLQVVNFDGNQLTDFPSINKLSNLEELDLDYNKLKKLPQGIEDVKNLKILHVSDNNIDDSTTDKLQQLSNLVSLDLGNNKLTKIPAGIEKLKKLQYLRLSGNKIDKTSLAALKQTFPHTTIDL